MGRDFDGVGCCKYLTGDYIFMCIVDRYLTCISNEVAFSGVGTKERSRYFQCFSVSVFLIPISLSEY